MRPIKFRAWYEKEKKMFTPIVEVKDGDLIQWASDFDTKFLKWMQFTGLLDKNGKEIYEGDVVRIDTEDKLKEVKFGEFQDIEGGHQCGFYVDINWKGLFGGDGIEVLGNIYENKNLLK